MPVPHWGMALRVDQFHALAERVRAGGISFEIEPHLRFKGARRLHCQMLVTAWAPCSVVRDLEDAHAPAPRLP